MTNTLMSHKELSDMKKVSWIVIGIGVLILWIGFSWTYSLITFHNEATLMEATVTDTGDNGELGDDHACYPTISFTVEGEVHSYTFTQPSSGCFYSGHTIEAFVLKNPEGQWEAMINQPFTDWFWRLFVISFGMIFLGVGMFLWKATDNTQEVASGRAPMPEELLYEDE